MALEVVCKALKTKNPTIGQIADLNHDAITEESVTAAAEYIESLYQRLGGYDQVAKGKQLIEAWNADRR